MSDKQTTTTHDELKRAMLAAMGAALAGVEAAQQRYSDRVVELTNHTIEATALLDEADNILGLNA